MRIQHNIAALNSYRNLTNNNNAVAKNLEKLSSGYKINRAGDDAAGLAISEKMRAQITGLETAQKNANDGISLVQTAEGALTEVHSMLNRMLELADQSANGTYQNEVDRENLQAEVDSLRDEINRISESTNFNGINLLDGSLSAAGKPGSSGSIAADLSNLGLDLSLSGKTIDATKGEFTTNSLLNLAGATDSIAVADGDTLNFTLKYVDKDGKEQTVDIKLTFKPEDGNAGSDIKEIWLDDGTETGKKLNVELGANGKITQKEVGDALAEALMTDKGIRENFEVSSSNGNLKFESRVPGQDGAKITGYDISTITSSGTETTYAGKITAKEGEDAYTAYDMASLTAWDGKESSLEDSIFEINGKKFIFVDKDTKLDEKALEMLDKAGVEHWVQTGTGGTIADDDVASMIEKIKKETGLDIEQGTETGGVWQENTTGTQFVVKNGTSKTEGTNGGGLRLQIGDTSDDFNQITVSVDAMDAKSLGIGDISVADQDDAADAVELIKTAINKVSSTRGNLGAIQNRLEHTINNLSVTAENITAAESRIRDVDMADEMMAYTKNNILVQSSQAMLAQANQLPQGVLQLLQ